MTAAEAKELTRLSSEVDLKKVYDQIKYEAMHARNTARVDSDIIGNDNQIKCGIKRLEAEGYTVKRSSGSSFADGWDYLDVSW